MQRIAVYHRAGEAFMDKLSDRKGAKFKQGGKPKRRETGHSWVVDRCP